MREVTISVTDAARNFAGYVNRAHYQNVTFVLLKNGSPGWCRTEKRSARAGTWLKRSREPNCPQTKPPPGIVIFETDRKSLKTLANKWR